MDDDGAPTVMLVLTPTRVQENGGESVLTAALSGPLSEPVIVPVSASAVSPAVAADFELSADRTLTIAASATESTGTVKITAVDNAVDGPDKEVTVTAAVTGPGGLTDPPAETLTITDERRRGADRDAGAVP